MRLPTVVLANGDVMRFDARDPRRFESLVRACAVMNVVGRTAPFFDGVNKGP